MTSTAEEAKLSTSFWVSFSATDIKAQHMTSSQVRIDSISTSTSLSLNDSRAIVQSTPMRSSTTMASVSSTPGLDATAVRMTSTANLSTSKAYQNVTSSTTTESIIAVRSSVTSRASQSVTSAPERESFTITPNFTSRASQSVTSAPERESFTITPRFTSKASQSVTSAPSFTSVKSSVTFTSTFVASSQGNFTVSTHKSVTQVPGVTVTTSLFPSESLTIHSSVSHSHSSLATRTSSVTQASTVVTSTQLPSTTPRTTTEPYCKLIRTEMSCILMYFNINFNYFNLISCLISLAKPTIVKHTNPKIEVRKGQPLEMICHATGNPTPSITWKKDNISLKNTSRISIRPDYSLNILHTTSEDAGMYQCIATNGVGKDARYDAKVNIICKWNRSLNVLRLISFKISTASNIHIGFYLVRFFADDTL
jgi:hypothetical protein